MRVFEFLAARSRLLIRQQKEWVEILVDWETANRYAVLDPDDTDVEGLPAVSGTLTSAPGRAGARPVAYLAERAHGFTSMLKRWLLRSHRPFEIDVVGQDGTPLLHLRRSFFFLFSDLSVLSPDGRRIGRVRRRFGVLHKKYDLTDEHGLRLATISSPIWRLWTFPVSDRIGGKHALITKRWGGTLREMFTDSDTFLIDFTGSTDAAQASRFHASSGDSWTPQEKTLIFAAAISIDFDFFEDNSR